MGPVDPRYFEENDRGEEADDEENDDALLYTQPPLLTQQPERRRNHRNGPQSDTDDRQRGSFANTTANQ